MWLSLPTESQDPHSKLSFIIGAYKILLLFIEYSNLFRGSDMFIFNSDLLFFISGSGFDEENVGV